MRLVLAITLCLALLPVHGWAQPGPPPKTRPTDPSRQYLFDLMCTAADHHWSMNGGEVQTPEKKAESVRLLQRANQSGAAIGKDKQKVSDELLSLFSGYLHNPRPYFGMTSTEMRHYCVTFMPKT